MEGTRAAIVSYIILAVTATAAVCVEVAAQAMGGPGIGAAFRGNLFTQAAAAGPYLMYRLWEGDSQRAQKSIALACAAILVPLALTSADWLSYQQMLAASVLGLGLIGLGSMSIAAFSPRPDRGRWRQRLASTIYLPLGVAMAPFFLWLSGQVNPVYDLYVFAFEETLGPRFSVLAVHLFEALPPLKTAASLCYMALPLGIAAIYAFQQRGQAEADIAVVFMATSVIGFALYFVFPVVGPLSVYGSDFPDNLPPPGSIVAGDLSVFTGSPRNGMPSLHTAWAVLIWINARPLATVPRRLLRVFAVLNLLATMGLLDAHWLTDLVVGAPLAVAVQALCNVTLSFRSRARWTVVVGGAALVGAWFCALWWGIPYFESVRGLSWCAVVATLVAVVALERSLRTATTFKLPVLASGTPAL